MLCGDSSCSVSTAKYNSDGYKQSHGDPCVFYRVSESGTRIIIGLYVDDTLILYDDDAEYQELVATITSKFDYSEQSPLRDLCGIEVTETEGYVQLTLTDKINKLAEQFLSDSERNEKVHVPATEKLEALVEEALKSTATPSPELLQEFRELLGALLFIFITVRVEIGYAMGLLCRVGSKPTPETMEEAKRVLKYLHTYKDLGLRYSRHGSKKIEGMSDSDWNVTASISAYVFLLAGAAVSYLSKKQPTIAMASQEAEIYAASLAGLEAVYLACLYSEITGKKLEKIDIGVDNSGAVSLANDYVSNSRVRHYSRRHLKIRELVEEGLVAVNKVGTLDNISDLLSKALGRRKFEKFRKAVLNM